MRRPRLHCLLVLSLLAASACKPGPRQAERKSVQRLVPASLDLLSDTVDANGFLVNPRFVVQGGTDSLPAVDALCGHFQVRSPSDPRFLNGCTTYRDEIVFVPAKLKLGPLCKGPVGHVNWRYSPARPPKQSAVTVWGRVFAADETMFGVGGVGNLDGDIGLMLQTPGNPGRTSHNPLAGGASPAQGTSMLELEFRLQELREKWSDESFWTTVADDVGVNSRRIHRNVDGLMGVAVGVFGMDGVHESHSEIHPVMGLALRTAASSTTDTWVVFVRNWGDEGMCGQDDQPLELPHDTLYLWLPWREGATAVRASFTGSKPIPARTFRRDSIAVAFPLPRPSRKVVIDGILTLTWAGPAKPPSTVQVPRVPIRPQVETAEERLAKGLSRSQRARIDSMVFPPSGAGPKSVRARGPQAPAAPAGIDAVFAEICRMKGDTIPDVGRCPPGLHR